jgi:hypothetical protein
MTTLTACAALLSVFVPTALAERIVSPQGGYSFDFPAGWHQLPQEGYTISGPDDETLVEIDTPKSARNLGELSRASRFVAAAMGFDKPGKDDVNLEGTGWQGQLSYLRGKYGAKQVKSTLMVFIVRGPKGFRTFWLVASDKVLAQRESAYLDLFKSIMFDVAAIPAPAPAEPAAPTPAPGAVTPAG